MDALASVKLDNKSLLAKKKKKNIQPPTTTQTFLTQHTTTGFFKTALFMRVTPISSVTFISLNYWHILLSKGMSDFTSNTLFLRIQ